jgi:hypothetical protein
MADNQMVKIVFDFDLGNVPASAKKLSQYLKDNNLDLKFTKQSVDAATASLKQFATAQNAAGAAAATTGNQLKKSNMQWTNLALVIQDLPYGFRGIQNNLPALIGGFAGMTGAIYLITSAIIALFTALDNGVISFGKSSKTLEDYNKVRDSTYSTEIVKLKTLYNISNDVSRSMGARLEAAKALKEEYPGLLGKYSDEDIALGKAKISYDKLTTTILNYSRAKAAEGILTGIAAERLPLEIEATELLAKQRAHQAKGLTFVNQRTGEVMKAVGTYTVALQKNAEAQAKINKRAAPYVKILEATALAEIELEKSRAKAPKDKTIKGGKTPQEVAKEKARLAKIANDAETQAFIDTLDERAQKEYKAGLDLAENLEKMKAAGYTDSTTYYSAYRQNMLNIAKEYDDKEFKTAKDNADRIAKIQLDTRFDLANAITKINSDFAKEDIKNVEAQLSSTLKATRGNYQAQKDAIQLAINKLIEYRDASKEAGYGTKEFDDAIKNLGFSLEGLVDPIENFNTQLTNIINNTLSQLGASIGESIASSLLGTSGLQGALDMFLSVLAGGLIQVGELAIATGVAILGIKKALETLNPYVAIAAGIALIALGSFVRGSLQKKSEGLGGTKKFANGGIISGPTMGLMGEYPGARSNPEVVAPLDKLKDLMGGGGGSLEARISGNDLLILMNKAQRNNNTTF